MTNPNETTTNPPTAAAPAISDPDTTGHGGEAAAPRRLWVYLLAGIYFGVVLTKSEALSWYRITEMFRFQSFHMYGILGSGVAVGALSLWLLRRLGVQAGDGGPMELAQKNVGYAATAMGGTVFGLGWALLGACPGPLYALIGSGISVVIVPLAAAIGGAWTYGALKPSLPH